MTSGISIDKKFSVRTDFMAYVDSIKVDEVHIQLGVVPNTKIKFITKFKHLVISLIPIILLGCNNAGGNTPSKADKSTVQVIETVPKFTNVELASSAENPAVGIGNLINSATRTIDIEAFYFNDESGTSFDQDLMRNLLAKANQGVKINIVIESGISPVGGTAESSFKNALYILQNNTNVKIVANNYFDSIGGIIHAKMLLVDGNKFFIGSQNFDSVAFELNHELGAIESSSTLTSQLEKVFNADFNNDPNYDPSTAVPSTPSGNIFIATSPNFNGIPSEINNIIRLINNAKFSVNIQAMVNQNYNPYQSKYSESGYWLSLQNALVSAANRGVKVNVMVSNWEFQKGKMFNYDNQYLSELESISNIEVRYSSFPQTIGGVCIPYSEVDHAKFMIVDNQNVWIGTGNLAQAYFTSVRDYSLFVINDPIFGVDINNIFLKIWNSAYMTEYFSSVPYSSAVQPWCSGK